MSFISKAPWKRECREHHPGMVEVTGTALTIQGFRFAKNVGTEEAVQIETDADAIAALPEMLQVIHDIVDIEGNGYVDPASYMKRKRSILDRAEAIARNFQNCV